MYQTMYLSGFYYLEMTHSIPEMVIFLEKQLLCLSVK